jgi:hypothetical protein
MTSIDAMFVEAMAENGRMLTLLQRCKSYLDNRKTVDKWGESRMSCDTCNEIWKMGEPEVHAEGCLYSDLGDELRRTHDV